MYPPPNYYSGWTFKFRRGWNREPLVLEQQMCPKAFFCTSTTIFTDGDRRNLLRVLTRTIFKWSVNGVDFMVCPLLIIPNISVSKDFMAGAHIEPIKIEPDDKVIVTLEPDPDRPPVIYKEDMFLHMTFAGNAVDPGEIEKNMAMFTAGIKKALGWEEA